MDLRKTVLLVMSGVTLLTWGMSAFAIMSVPSGWYLEGNIGSSRLSNKSYPGSASTTPLGGNLSGGYKFMPYFAAELGYTRYGDTTIKDQFGNKAATDKHFSWDIAGKGIVPLTDTGFEGFAKVGVQRLYSRVSITNTTAANNIGIASSSHSATGLYMGVGGQWYFMPEAAAVFQWTRAVGSSSTGTLDLWSIGVNYIIA